MFCRYCGKEIEDGAKFCKYCGKSQADAPDQASESQAGESQASESTENHLPEYNKTRLNARVLETLKKEFHIDPERELKNFTTFHGNGYWGPAVGVIVCAFLSFIVNEIRYARGIRLPGLNIVIYIALFAFVAWLIVILVRIFRSAFGITDSSLLVKIWPSEKYEIPLDQIEKVDIKAEPGTRAGVCGDLQIVTKEKTYDLKSISNVKNFKNTLEQQLK